uniref:Uncharacterized protein n=1 Tax=Oryzias latipes TaxID=8090 RepID=A0A3P9KBP4_ORYLA
LKLTLKSVFRLVGFTVSSECFISYKTNRKPRTPFTTMQILYLSFVERTRVKIWPQEAKQDKFQLDAGSRAILYSGFSCIAVPCSASQQGGSAGICRLYRSYKDKPVWPVSKIILPIPKQIPRPTICAVIPTIH